MQTLVRIPLFAVCSVAGYLLAHVLLPAHHAKNSAGEARPVAVIDEALVPATAENSSFIAEWEQLRGTGPNTPEALPGLYAEVKDLKDAFRRRAFRSALIGEWAASNPQAALAYLGEKDQGMVMQLIREWVRIDANAAVTALLAGGEKQHGNLRSVLADVAKFAPERLAEVISALPKSQSRWDTTAQDAFNQFALKDPEAARRAAESVTGPLRGQALAGVASAWAEKEGEAALKWGQAMPSGEERDAVLKSVLVGWAKTDPLAALDRIDLVPPGEEGYYASDVGARVLREAGKKDWDETMRWLRDHPGKLGRSSLDGLQDALSRRLAVDPGGAMRSVSTAGVPGMENVLSNSLLNDGYAQKDAIWQWLDRQPSNEFAASARSWVINATAWHEPMAAMALLEQLAGTEGSRTILERGARSMINGGAAMEQFDEFLEAASPKLRPYLLETGFSCGMDEFGSDPEKWVKRLDELPEDKRTEARRLLGMGWAMSDPASAMKWATSLPEGPQRDAAFFPVISGWAQKNSYDASQWIEKQPVGRTRDLATSSLVGALVQSQPETAWNWAITIEGEQERLNALQLAYIGVRRKNSAGADQLLEDARLPLNLLETLRQRIKSN